MWHSLERNNLAKEYKLSLLLKELNVPTPLFHANQLILISVFSMRKNHPVKNQDQIILIRIADR